MAGQKRALCVGINDYPGTGADLNGCVNDANAWAKLLTDHYGFASSDVTILLNADATKAKIMKELETLVAGAAAGDVLVFTNASHGTYVADTSGDEPEYDEAICPYDCSRNLIVDDELRELFTGLADGVSLTVISDSCFSGSVSRAPGMPAPDDRRARFLPPEAIGRATLDDPYLAKNRSEEKYPQSQMKDILLSGSSDNESSLDAKIDGQYHGVMSYFALKALKDADYRLTYAQLHARVRDMIEARRYPQHPQLEGKDANKAKTIFS
jgi:Caspase domain.